MEVDKNSHERLGLLVILGLFPQVYTGRDIDDLLDDPHLIHSLNQTIELKRLRIQYHFVCFLKSCSLPANA